METCASSPSHLPKHEATPASPSTSNLPKCEGQDTVKSEKRRPAREKINGIGEAMARGHESSTDDRQVVEDEEPERSTKRQCTAVEIFALVRENSNLAEADRPAAVIELGNR